MSDSGLMDLRYGSKEWEQRNAREVAARPRVWPIEKHQSFTSDELEQIRKNVAAGMNRAAAVKLVVDSRHD